VPLAPTLAPVWVKSWATRPMGWGVAAFREEVGVGEMRQDGTPDDAIHRAARSGDLPAVAALLADPAVAERRSATGWTPLHDAATCGSTTVIRALLDAGADPGARALDGLTPVMAAARAGHLAVVQQLLAAGADLEEAADTGRTVLESALQQGHLHVAAAVMAAGVVPDAPHAVLYVRALLDERGRRCRFFQPRAAGGRSTWAVDGPMDLSDDDLAPIAGELATPDPTDERPRLAFTAPVDFVPAPEVFSADEAGEPLPSHRWSWRQGWTEHVQAVLLGRLAPDIPDPFGNLALLGAIRAGCAPAVRGLLAAGADPNILPAKGCMKGATLLMNAAHQGDADVVTALLETELDVDARSPTGWTALMVAAGRGHQAAVHALLRAGTDATLRNAQGRTAMAIAQQRAHAHVARSLLVAANVHHLRRLEQMG
jgi:ankyrin repeat protein